MDPVEKCWHLARQARTKAREAISVRERQTWEEIAEQWEEIATERLSLLGKNVLDFRSGERAGDDDSKST